MASQSMVDIEDRDSGALGYVNKSGLGLVEKRSGLGFVSGSSEQDQDQVSKGLGFISGSSENPDASLPNEMSYGQDEEMNSGEQS